MTIKQIVKILTKKEKHINEEVYITKEKQIVKKVKLL